MLWAIAATLAGVYLAQDEARHYAAPFRTVGLDYDLVDRKTRIFAYSNAARRAGIEGPLTLLSIDGHPIADDAAALDRIVARIRGEEGTVVSIRTRSAEGRVRDFRLIRSAADNLAEPYGAGVTGYWLAQVAQLLIWSIPNLILIFTAFLLFSRRSGDSVAALLSLSFLLHAGSSFIAWWTYLQGFPEAFPVQQIAFELGWDFLALVVLVFPSGRFEPRWTLAIALALPIVALFGIAILPTLEGNARFTANLLLIMPILAAVAAAALRHRALPQGPERQQIKWVILGFAAGGALQIVQQAFMWWTSGREDFNGWIILTTSGLGAASIACFALGLLVSLLRYRLYDADAIISHSAGYAVLTVGFVAIFAGGEKAIEIIGERYFEGSAGIATGGAAAALAAVVIGPLHGRMRGWAERRFQKGLVRLRRDLPVCVGDLRETASLGQLLDAALARIGDGLRAQRAAILLRQGERLELAAARGIEGKKAVEWARGWTPAPNAEGFDCASEDPLFPLRVALAVDDGVARETIGWILLGPRPDGSFYGKDEQRALAEVADPVARAVQIVMLRVAREAAVRKEVRRLGSRLASLEAALAGALASLRLKPAAS